MSHLTFKVMGKTNMKQDDFIAFASIPLPALCCGFRTVLLYSKKGSRLNVLQNSSLFVHISISQVVSDNNNWSEVMYNKSKTRQITELFI